MIEKAIWTVIPNGIINSADGKKQLKFSVFISPRLNEGGITKEYLKAQIFPLFSNWPKTLKERYQDQGFSLEFETDQVSLPALPDPDSWSAREDLWTALFNPDVSVEPYTFDEFDTLYINSFPYSSVSSFIKNVFKSASHSKFTFPTLKDSTSYYHKLEKIYFGDLEILHKYERQLSDLFKKNKVIPPGYDNIPQLDPDSLDFLQLLLYYQQYSTLNPPKNITLKKDIPVIPKPDLDFHKIVSAIGDYPRLLRELGLVLDCVVNLPEGVNLSKTGLVTLKNSNFKSTIDKIPSTNYVLTANRFVPGTIDPSSEISNSDENIPAGFLKLQDPNYFSVEELDVEGSALKLVSASENLYYYNKEHKTLNNPDIQSAPAIRSRGISLIRQSRAFHFMKLLEKSKHLNDYLIKGIQSGSPSSQTVYADDLVRGYRVDIIDTTSKKWNTLCERIGNYTLKDTNSKEIYREIFQDEGIVSPAALKSSKTPTIPISPSRPALEAALYKGLYLHESLLHWDGWSLCVPRPERIIQNRVVGQDDETWSSYQPDPYSNLQTEFFVPPGSLPRLRFGRTYRMRARIVDIAGNSIRTDEIPEDDFSIVSPELKYTRYEPVNPPIILFKEKPHNPADFPGESIERIVIRSNYDVNATIPSKRYFAPPQVSPLLAERHSMFDGMATDKIYNLMKEKDVQVEMGETCNPSDLSYLPDPLSLGVSFRVKLIKGPVKMSYFGDPPEWPEFKPVIFTLTEDTSISWSCTGNAVTVGLPKAEMVRVYVSSLLDKNKVHMMGPCLWNPGDENEAAMGMLCLLTPYKEIVLVHAVQQPLIEPQFANFISSDEILGETFAKLSGSISIDGKSTGKISITAEWEDAIDNPADPGGPKAPAFGNATTKTTNVFEIPVHTDSSSETISSGVTIYESTGVHGTLHLGYGHTALHQEFGDTKHRNIRYTATGSSRFREYFDENAEEKLFARSGKPVQVSIRSKERPAAPKALYIIPVFRWESREWERISTDTFRHTRHGGGLRVYMDRPWYSSGDGELLGVLLPKKDLENNPTYMAAASQSVTQWGMDPIWISKPVSDNPHTDNFQDYESILEEGVHLGEIMFTPQASSNNISLVAYPVTFDPDRKLWYADIFCNPAGIAGPPYFPFIRLALARYQPDSMEGVELSRVILMDPVQLLPTRTAEVKFLSEDHQKLQITLRGDVFPGPNFSGKENMVAVSVERRIPGIDDPHLCWDLFNTYQMVSMQTYAQEPVWGLQISLPEVPKKDGTSFRVVIKEYESYIADSEENVVEDEPVDFTIAGHLERREVNSVLVEKLTSSKSEGSTSAGMTPMMCVVQRPNKKRLVYADSLTI